MMFISHVGSLLSLNTPMEYGTIISYNQSMVSKSKILI
jgi:hypothetical protein